MIEILHPGVLSIIVDEGRAGYGDIGVALSGPCDEFSYTALNLILGNKIGAPAIEVVGPQFSFRAREDLLCAITGAEIEATSDQEPIKVWNSFLVKKGGVVRVRKVAKGFRYYVGFAGEMDVEFVMGSATTNLEGGFGGFGGRPLRRGDVLFMKNVHIGPKMGLLPDLIPKMAPPYVLRTIQGPEISMFRPESVEEVFKGGGSFPLKVSLNSNRTGIRLEGYRLEFVDGVETSIVSEALLPGVIQVPGDGHPIIVLKERTVGGYARIAHVIKADQWILGQLKPGDTVGFGMVDMGTAEMLYKDMIKALFEGIITREGG